MSDSQKQLENSIREQCFEFQSILDYFRDNYYDDVKYQRFYETAKKYYQVIKDQPDINRETAGYLQTFQSLLERALSYHYETKTNPEMLRKLERAYDESAELFAIIYFGEDG